MMLQFGDGTLIVIQTIDIHNEINKIKQISEFSFSLFYRLQINVSDEVVKNDKIVNKFKA